MKYKLVVVQNSSDEKLHGLAKAQERADEIRILLSQGWTPHGSPVATSGNAIIIYQAFILLYD